MTTADTASKAIRLAETGWLREPPLRRVLAALDAGAGCTRIVGGAVRDAILGRPVREVDLATVHDPATVTARAEKAGLHAVPTGIDHGTVSIVCDGRMFEVTTLRVDVETHGRHATVAFTGDWEADARRRDFTMNALYADGEGHVFDPLDGHGDITAGRVRFIGDADARIEEDYLRILRFFRMHAHYGRGAPDPAGLSACIRKRAGLARLSGERVGHEMLRLLAAPDPRTALEAMYDSGILPLVLGGVPYIAQAHRLMDIERMAWVEPDPVLRLAVLGCVVAEDAERIAARLRLSGKQKDRLTAMTGFRGFGAAPDEAALRLALYRLGAPAYGDLVLAAWSHDPDAARDPAWLAALTLPERWTVPERPWGGVDITSLGVPPGPAVGRILKAAEEAWIKAGYPASAAARRRLLDQAVGAWKKRHEL